jgi:hypothetical protein
MPTGIMDPFQEKNKCQKCLGKFSKKGKFYVIYSKVKIGMALTDNPAFFSHGSSSKRLEAALRPLMSLR